MYDWFIVLDHTNSNQEGKKLKGGCTEPRHRKQSTDTVSILT